MSRRSATPSTLGNVVAWIASVPLLILSLAAVLITLVDLVHPFGLEVLPALPKGATAAEQSLYSSIKVVVLLIGLLSGTLAADRVLHFQQVERSLADVDRDVGLLVAEKEARVDVLETRGQVYATFLATMSKLPQRSKVLITHYEKLKMAYSTGEEASEQALMEVWGKSLRSGQIDVEQIVHVSSQDDLDEALKRAMTYRSLPNFSLSIVMDLLPDPFFEYAVLGDSTVLVTFSAQSTSPYATDFGVLVSSQVFARKMTEHFRMWSSRFGIAVKTRDAVHGDTVEELRRGLPKGHPLDLPSALARLALSIARNSILFAVIRRLIVASEEIDMLARPIFRDHMIATFEDAAERIEAFAQGRIVMGPEGMFELQGLIRNAKTSVEAVCPGAGLAFWSTQLGRSVLGACREAVTRGVKVRRLFVLDSEPKRGTDEWLILTEHASTGIDVFVVLAGDAGPELVRDYAIVDGSLVFEDMSTSTAKMVAIEVGPGHVRQLETLWRRTVQVAHPFEPQPPAPGSDPTVTNARK